MERRATAHGRLPRAILATIVGSMLLGASPWSVLADETPAPTASVAGPDGDADPRHGSRSVADAATNARPDP